MLSVQEGPGEAAVAALGEATETPERLWTPAMKATTAEEVAHLAAQAHSAQVNLTLLLLLTHSWFGSCCWHLAELKTPYELC